MDYRLKSLEMALQTQQLPANKVISQATEYYIYLTGDDSKKTATPKKGKK